MPLHLWMLCLAFSPHFIYEFIYLLKSSYRFSMYLDNISNSLLPTRKFSFHCVTSIVLENFLQASGGERTLILSNDGPCMFYYQSDRQDVPSGAVKA